MKHRFPILPAAAMGLAIGLASIPLLRPIASASADASASGESAKEPQESDKAQSLLSDSARAIAALDSANVKIRVRVDLFDQQFTGSGRYLQGDSTSRQFRLELKLQLGDSFSSVQQVCDGKTLWIRRQLDGPAKISKIDVQRAQDALRHPPATSTAVSAMPGLTPSVGGLGGIVRGLDRAFDFRWIAETKLGPTPMFVVYGVWKPAQLARMLPDQKAGIDSGGRVDLTKLHPHVPDHVVVYLDRVNVFPYRIEYRRSTTGDPAAAVRGQSTAKTLVSMELYESRFGSGVDSQEFVYTPGHEPVADETDEYLAGQGG